MEIRELQVKDIDYIDVFKLVEKHNIELLKSYYVDVNVKNEFKVIDGINDFKELYKYKYEVLGVFPYVDYLVNTKTITFTIDNKENGSMDIFDIPGFIKSSFKEEAKSTI